MSFSVDPSQVPARRMYTGNLIPSVGIGTFGSDKYTPQQIAEAVYQAVKNGYRLVDCASVYQNEHEIGNALERVLADGLVKRQDLFVTSKVWNDSHEDVVVSCKKSLSDLGLQYIDLYFVHWPFPNYHAPGCDGDARNPNSKPFCLDEFMKTWRQCEHLVAMGLVKQIGMSNMTIPKLEAALPICRIQPAALELECHPSFQQKELFNYAVHHGIVPIGYCPIGSPSRPERDRTPEDVADTQMPAIIKIAERHKVHPALICLKWAVQRGLTTIPFSVKEEQFSANLRCATEDFLTDEEMHSIEKADKNCRLVKGQVFLWEGADGWEDLWDMQGIITK